MKANDRTPSSFSRVWRPLLVGLCVGVITCTAVLLLLALLVGRVDIPRPAILPLAIVAGCIGALLAGWVAARMTGKNGLLLGLAEGLLLFLLILAAGYARYTGVSTGTSLMKLGLLLVAGGIGGVLGVGRK